MKKLIFIFLLVAAPVWASDEKIEIPYLKIKEQTALRWSSPKKINVIYFRGNPKVGDIYGLRVKKVSNENGQIGVDMDFERIN